MSEHENNNMTESGEQEMTQEKRVSVVDFDREEFLNEHSEKTYNDLTTENLLKLTICSAETDKNITVSTNCKNTLKQINGETLRNRSNTRRRNNNRNYHRNGGRRRPYYNNPRPTEES